MYSFHPAYVQLTTISFETVLQDTSAGVKVHRFRRCFASKIVIRSEAPEMLTLGPRTLISNVPCTKWKEIALDDITASCCESHINIATSFSVKSTHELAGLISGTESL